MPVPGSNPGEPTIVEFSFQDIEDLITELSISGCKPSTIRDMRKRLTEFAEFCCYRYNLNNIKIYLEKYKKNYSIDHKIKILQDIKRLTARFNPELAKRIRPPKPPKRRKIVIKREHIQNLLNQAENLTKTEHLRLKAAILLSASSGLRAMELNKLTAKNIEIENRTIYLEAEITKDFEDRITFFNNEAKEALTEFLTDFKPKNKIFPESTLKKSFKKFKMNTELRIKHMRKFFSQQSDRLGMPTAVKKMLMGHSMSRDVDLSHYDF